jgi:L-fuconolactonase
MDIVESHVHVSLSKFPRFEEYLLAMSRAGISAAILSQNIGNFDNDYLIQCAKQEPKKFRAIIMLDFQDPNIELEIKSLSMNPEVIGVRLWAKSSGPLEDPLRIWRAIYESGLIASVRGPIADINGRFFHSVVNEFPHLRIRLEHLGSFRFSMDSKEEFEKMMDLARFPNIYLMWAGFLANSDFDYPFEDAYPFLLRCFENFGPERIMWSGDWNRPTVQGRVGAYKESIDFMYEKLSFLRMRNCDVESIMGATARDFFRFAKK